MQQPQIGTFPFGQPIRRVVQADRGPKRVFVLGVYSSAVHARWCGVGGNELVKALAVATEPSIFWSNNGGRAEVEGILSEIYVPRSAGHLEPAELRYNGATGRSFDEDYLKPLNLTRNDVWMCDLVPHSCMNPNQKNALECEYFPLVDELSLPDVDWQPEPKQKTDTERRSEIAAELRSSGAEILITLGEDPLKFFARYLGSRSSLEEYGKNSSYGNLHDIKLDGRALKLLPLVHPRQAAGMLRNSKVWNACHTYWTTETAFTVARSI